VDLNEILAATLRRGCGIELDELVQSEDFRSRVALRTAWFEQLEIEDSDLGVAYRAGHLEMGGLLNALPEDMALQYAKAEAAPDPYLSVLLEVIGEELLKAATACLPLEVKASTALYPSCDAEAQLRLINATYQWLYNAYEKGKQFEKQVASKAKLGDNTVLCKFKVHGVEDGAILTAGNARDVFAFYANLGRNDDALKVASAVSTILTFRNGECQGAFPALDPEAINLIIDYFVKNASELAHDEWIRSFTEIEYGVEKVLPMEYGKLGTRPGVPCCLGMSLMLSAFARLTGLPVMLVSPLECGMDYEYRVNKEYGQALLEHLREIKSSDSSFQEALKRQVAIAEGNSGRVMDFHYSIAMKVADGRWVQLDPYLNVWGCFGEDWQLDRVYSLLVKYKSVLPGLTLVADDGGELALWKEKWIGLFNRAIKIAEHLLTALYEVPVIPLTDTEVNFWDPDLPGMYDVDFLWTYDVATAADDLHELAGEVAKLQGYEIDQDYFLYVENAVRSEITKIVLSGYKPGDNEFDLLTDTFSTQFNTDTVFRTKKIEKLAIRVIDWIIAEWCGHVADPSDRILDPTMQFSLPEYNLGLAVTSHVRSWTYADVPGRLLVGLSSSQFLWHDAVDLSRGSDQGDMDHPDVMRAEATVRAQPYQHAACTHKLHYIAGLRQEGTRDGQEEGAGG